VKPKSNVRAVLKIWDIAGLVPNAHQGEGLGNAFLRCPVLLYDCKFQINVVLKYDCKFQINLGLKYDCKFQINLVRKYDCKFIFSHIQAVDGIYHVCRAFTDADIGEKNTLETSEHENYTQNE
jgi:hypothetical protein